MKQIASVILALLFCVQAMAQQLPHAPHKPHKLHKPHDKERIDAIKVGFITDRLDLSPKEAEGFWPIYNSYEKESRRLWHNYKEKHPEQFRKSRDQYLSKEDRKKTEQQLDGEQEFREQKLALRREYKSRFLTVISATKLAALYEAEADFRQMLIKQVKHKKGMGPRGKH